jgi:hypothetical protein
VTVPAGVVTVPTQIEFLSGTSAGFSGTPELVFGVQLTQNGAKLSGPFAHPITVSAAGPMITAGSTVFVLTAAGFTPDPSFTVTAGLATGSFTSDIDFLIASTAAAPAAATVPGATLPLTGKPFLGEGLLAIGLLTVGGLGFWRWRRLTRSNI